MSPRRPTVALLFRIFRSRSLSDTRLAPALIFRIFRSRSLSDTRLAPVLLFCSFRSRRHSDPRLAPSIYYLYVWSYWLTYSCTSCSHLLYLMSELSCEYFHSTHLACWFGQMLTKAISWMKSLIARPTPRGVPVSPARSRILVTCIIYASAPAISLLEPHSDARRAVVFRSHITRFAVIFPLPSLS